jgi:hypothetical protein
LGSGGYPRVGGLGGSAPETNTGRG